MVNAYPKTLFNIVLIEPEIPNNTGNIGRTCVGLCSRLHLVGPLGFSIDDKQVKRSGLDYWQNLDLKYYPSRADWLKSLTGDERIHIIETGSSKTIYDIEFQEGDYLVFGKETKGLPQDILEKFSEHVYSIPFPGQIRSFNLSNCVAMVMGEGLRQLS
ncbi:MAG: tRNA (cytidine(34)-2'-O)-methyltransferase [Bdellovibrionales bacterium]|nr:tRNA (cytidine(34)-2'-O)-methyltransferase [Bdellovibrionales bacterium]